MNNILSIDPSGTGTTGLYWTEQSQFTEFQSKDWKQHLAWLVKQVQAKQPSLLLYEHTNFISLKGKDMTGLLQLFGGIESLSHFLLTQVATIPVNQVKRLKEQLLKGTKQIEGITYQPGRGKGWMFAGQRISLHQLEAYLVYHLWKQKNNPSYE